MSKTILVLAFAIVFLTGCVGTHYVPPTFDQKESRYKAIASVDKDKIAIRDTSVNLRKFKVVYLAVDSNVHPARLEFLLRDVLTRAGLKNIVNRDELIRVVRKREELNGLVQFDSDALKKISSSVGPVLLINARSMWDGDVRRYVSVRAIDAESGATLLDLNHPKFIWVHVDGEAHYPVFNELHSWVADSLSPARRG